MRSSERFCFTTSTVPGLRTRWKASVSAPDYGSKDHDHEMLKFRTAWSDFRSPASIRLPEVAGSTHLTKVLLGAKTRMKEYRAAMNLRYDNKMGSELSKLRLRRFVMGGSYPEVVDPIVEALIRQMKESSGPFDVIVDTGGSGIEPSLYLFATDPVEVARLALKIARLYSMGRN